MRKSRGRDVLRISITSPATESPPRETRIANTNTNTNTMDLDYLSGNRVATEGDKDREVRVLHLEGLHICDQA